MSDLQFDRVVHESAPSITQAASASCAVCHTAIPTEYYSVNGATVCFNCRNVLEAAAQTPRGAGPFLAAAALGLVAGIIGAAIYYGVIAIATSRSASSRFSSATWWAGPSARAPAGAEDDGSRCWQWR
jgi:hypothetical protein